MPDRGFKTITVTEQLYERIKQKAKKEKKSAASYVSDVLVNMLYVDEKFSNYVPFLELVALESSEVIIRDVKKDKIADVRTRRTDGSKLELYCTLDQTDYCPHTAFAAALPQVLNATRR
jgi:predicted CopG family antitoxin